LSDVYIIFCLFSWVNLDDPAEKSATENTDTDNTTTPAAGTTSLSEENAADTLASEKGVLMSCYEYNMSVIIANVILGLI
jgi:hypothetical protein